MAVFETWIESDLQKMIVPRALQGNAFCMDSGANLIGVSVMDGGEPATLSGTVAGKVVRSDGTTVPVTGGTLSGNRASIILPQRAYEVPGPIAIAVTLTSGSTVTTIGAVTGYVVRSQTDSIIDPGTILPTIDTLINQIQTAIDSIPADYSQVIHSIAPSFSSSTAYSTGDIVWYPGEATNPGALYQFTSAHAAGEWTGTDATAAVFANELSLLKSTFNNFTEDKIEIGAEWSQGRLYISNSVLTLQSSNYYIYTNFLQNDKQIEVIPKSGYKVCVWRSVYDELGHGAPFISDGYVTEKVVCEPNALYPYIILCVAKSNNGTISTSEDCVDISKSDSTIFATKTGLASVEAQNNYFRPFSNDEVNKFIPEYYQDSATDLSTVAKIRIYNGQGDVYGFKLFRSDNTQVIDCTFSEMPTDVANKLFAYAVFANLSSLGALYKDYPTTINSYAKVEEAMPSIYTYRRMKSEVDPLKTNLPFTNSKLNLFVKELFVNNNYIDLSVVAKVRVYNGQGGVYGIKLFKSDNTQVIDCTVSSVPANVVKVYSTYGLFTNLDTLGVLYKDFNTSVNPCVKNLNCMPTIYAYIHNQETGEELENLDGRVTLLEEGTAALSSSCVPTKGQILYEGDTKSNSGYIVNAVSYADGVIIACRADGKVVRIGYSGTEETLLTINGTAPFDWRGCFMDSNENVYVSPHASMGSMSASDRGLYRLAKGGSSFTKVISLYNSSSTVPTEAENNNDTIWTMCEDDDGNLYAGVYAHTVRANPAIYKSTDGGSTWTYTYNFKTARDTPSGMHIHTIIWSKWQKALYVIVGEVNTVFRSEDGGSTWENLHVTLTVKGSSMLATQFGILIGSDGAYNCDIDILENDNSTHRKVFRGWANTIFAIRQSDVTGMIYAFTKIDSSVNSTSYYPPVGALTDPDVIDTWHTSVGDAIYNAWKAYYDSVIDIYPSDAIRPQHYAILVSRDGGNNWEVLHAFSTSSQTANGCWTTGYFNNGECLTGRIVNSQAINPIVISEGKHKYVSGGCDLDGEIFVRTNSSSTVTVVN